jgi:ubiquinone/menaquinone biosynthesis C-methylase UbiE
VSELSNYDPTGRFTGLAGIYAKSRPSYPDQAIEFILEHCGLTAEDHLVDVGCGTGISSRLFAERSLQVVGIEPNADMRREAEIAGVQAGCMPPVYHAGTAEATGLADQSTEAVLCAQSFHWFSADLALKEFHRILRERKWVILMWNERDESDQFTAAYGDILRSWPEIKSVEVPRRQSGQALLQSKLYENAQRVTFANAQTMTEQGLIGRAFSASYAPKDAADKEVLTHSLSDLFKRYQSQGSVALQYETAVYVGQKKSIT